MGFSAISLGASAVCSPVPKENPASGVFGEKEEVEDEDKEGFIVFAGRVRLGGLQEFHLPYGVHFYNRCDYMRNRCGYRCTRCSKRLVRLGSRRFL